LAAAVDKTDLEEGQRPGPHRSYGVELQVPLLEVTLQYWLDEHVLYFVTGPYAG
jgi:hypothetical protein